MGLKQNINDIEIDIVLDCSASMAIRDCTNMQSRFLYSQQVILEFLQYLHGRGSQGINILPFSSTCERLYDHTDYKNVDNVFIENEPCGTTNTTEGLQRCLDRFFSRKRTGSSKQTVVFLLTDGVPKNEIAFESLLLELFGSEVGDGDRVKVLVIQIGKEAALRSYLNKLKIKLERLTRQEQIKPNIIEIHNMEDLECRSLTSLLENTMSSIV